MVDTGRSLHAVDRERLPIGGTLSKTFRVFGKAPLVFLSFGLLSQAMLLGRLAVAPPAKPNFSLAEGTVMVGTFLLSFFLQTAMTYWAFRRNDAQATSAGEALALGLRRYLPMAGTTLLYLLATYASLLLLILPGIFVGLIFAVAVQVCALEGVGPIASLKRSMFLTMGERWRLLGIYCLFFIPFLVLAGIIAATLTMRGDLVAGQLCSAAAQIVWVPLAAILSTVVYADLRRLKESVGVARIFD